MNVGSLFSGIGGMDAGLARAGHRHVFFCESDPYRRDVLAARWPGVPVYEDVRTLGKPAARAEADGCGTEPVEGGCEAGAGLLGRGDVGLLCGGFPCQDLSVAGRRRGLDGERSGLFFEFARLIDAFRPGWVLVENVPGLLSSNGGRDFGVVLGTLADLGYGVAWRVLDSRFFGVPQRRRRVFIVGAVADGDPRAAAERAGEVLAVGSRCPGHPATRGEARQDDPGAPVAGTLGGRRGFTGDDIDRGGGHTSLSGLGNGGPDDNDAQAGRLVVARALTSHPDRQDATVDTFVAHSLTSAGHDASEDGTGRGTPIIAFPISGDALRAGDAKTPSPDAEGRIRLRDPGLGIGAEGDPAFTVTGASPGAVAAPLNQVMVGLAVRRLTPTECERLQGLPDGWTLLDGTPDSRRYSALGDAVTANVAEWLGSRLEAA